MNIPGMAGAVMPGNLKYLLLAQLSQPDLVKIRWAFILFRFSQDYPTHRLYF